MLSDRRGKQRTTESVYLPPRYHGEGEYPQHSANPRRMPPYGVLPNLSLELTGLKSLSVFLPLIRHCCSRNRPGFPPCLTL